MDYPDNRRQEVIDYVIQKYGRESVCQIITFGTMAARSAIRAVGRALDYPYSVCDTMAKLVPMEIGMTLKKALEVSTDIQAKYRSDENIRILIDTAMSLEGLPLYTGTHAAGVLITDRKGVNAHVPTWNNDGAIVSQFPMGTLEELGLLKMDFLGLKTLGVVDNAVKHIKNNCGVDIDLDELYQCKDTSVLQLIADGNTQGIFQLESGGMTQFMMELKPKNIEEITAGIALYRPGPMQYIPRFLENRRNPNGITYDFEELRPILEETFGVLVYQEQTMRTVIALAGYQKHHSDSFRKAISKKKADLITLHRGYFIEGRPEKWNDDHTKMTQDAIPGGVALGRPREKLEKLYSEMEEFGKYCFNKSHAAAYAVLGYVTCWLKFYYPTEFMAALMDSVNKNKKKVARYISHCTKDLGIEILPPDINRGEAYFIPLKGKKIVYSLSAKGASDDVIDAIKDVRAEASIESVFDLFVRCSDSINKQTFESLISIGAFDNLGVIRSQYLAALDDIIKKLQRVKAARKRAIKSGRPFDFSDKFTVEEFVPPIKEFPNDIKLRLEKKYLGLYLSGHPLHRYMYAIKNTSDFKTSDIDFEIDEDTGDIIMVENTVRNGQKVKFIGLISEVKEVVTKKKDQMAIAEVEDLEGACRLVLFPDTFKNCKQVLKEDEVYKIYGTVSIKPDEAPCIFCETLEPISATLIKRLIIDVDSVEDAQNVLEYIGGLIVPGGCPVYFQYGGLHTLLKKKYWVDIDLFTEFYDRKLLSAKKIQINEW